MVAKVGRLSVTVNVSFDSTSVSPFTVMSIVAEVSPSAMFVMPLTMDIQSLPAVAGLSPGPSDVSYSTDIAVLGIPVLVIVNVKVLSESPSTWDTSLIEIVGKGTH